MNTRLLEIQNLAYSYTPAKQIFEDINFVVEAGKIFVLLGPNGSGKTTLLNCASGLLSPTAGRVLINGEDLASLSITEAAKRLGYLSQLGEQSTAYTAADYLVMGRAPYLPFGASPSAADYAQAYETLERVGVPGLADTPTDKISGGERQLIRIARVLMQDTRLIFMDEPTNHLDYGNRLRVLRLITRLASEGYSILLTSHMPDDAQFLKGAHVGMLQKGGHFLYGSPNEVLTEARLSALYGTDIRIYPIESLGYGLCVPADSVPEYASSYQGGAD